MSATVPIAATAVSSRRLGQITCMDKIGLDRSSGDGPTLVITEAHRYDLLLFNGTCKLGMSIILPSGVSEMSSRRVKNVRKEIGKLLQGKIVCQGEL